VKSSSRRLWQRALDFCLQLTSSRKILLSNSLEKSFFYNISSSTLHHLLLPLPYIPKTSSFHFFKSNFNAFNFSAYT